ncbi:MAG: CRISPR-associated protein Cas2 [Thermotogaceae bacterium]|jgi:CRISPR-associated protein Cas2|nr:CRISPR-associated protein Cas2 [Thermotogaceae bacterium]
MISKVAYIISYDISDTKKRNKVAKVLEEYGERIQYSVFICYLERKILFKLLERVTKLIDKTTDSIIAMAITDQTAIIYGTLKNNVRKEKPETWNII